ncbi:protein of unknown function [Saccharopolyspora shandongensis]|uniref:DUF397 domain-containing protein n=1 Tax=Saccharopolyspora shandongensis TaxID=418495 RepID=A0A1H3LDI3_9PSEU|nr:DUF397 domain-containing protein [Saccharopolyspora shandongensis]SDY61935.1 protein of unknown function [Saccharopolyspora shandongensis]
MTAVTIDGWRKSSHSGTHNCIEVGRLGHNAAVRDTKDRDGGLLSFASERWSDFLAAVKVDKFNA